MCIGVIGHSRSDTQKLTRRIYEYGLCHGIDLQFCVYDSETDLIYGLLKRPHSGVIIDLPNADGLRLAERLSGTGREYRLTLLTDNADVAVDSYDVPVTLCLWREIDEHEMALIYKKMI